MRQHFIPKFLLRPWTGPDHLLQVFKLDGSHIRPFRRAPKSVAWREDLYSLSTPKNARGKRHGVETHFLQQIDDKGAKAKSKLLNPSYVGLSSEESMDWGLFLMSLRARQPHAVEHLRRTGAETLRRELDADPEEYRSIAGQGDPERLSEWVQKNVPGFIENWTIAQFPAISSHSKTLEAILTMGHHDIVDFTGCSEHLLLSDDPCIWIHGSDHPRFTVALPVSPYAAYIGTSSDVAYRSLRSLSQESLLENMNISSVNQARNYIYALNRSPQEFIVDCRTRSNANADAPRTAPVSAP